MTKLIACMEKGLDQGIAQGHFPGGIANVSFHDGSSYTVCRGKTSNENGHVVTEDTVYDLASLTKVVATLPSILLSVQAGKLSLIDPVAKHIPELESHEDERVRNITIYHLLTHTSGLPAWRPFFIRSHDREDYIRAISSEQLIGDPGKQVVYSDLGFMLLGFILERVWDQELHVLADSLVFKPLRMNDTSYLPLEHTTLHKRVIAPTENGNSCERDMAKQYMKDRSEGIIPSHSFGLIEQDIESLAWRTGVIKGTVHDCNAHYGLNGISGHAGLFSTIGDVQKYMASWVNADSLFDPILRDFAVSLQTGDLSKTRAVGWEHSSTGGQPHQVIDGCSGGDLVSSRAFGHTGFTGTSAWCDPIRKMTVITLTNRVHPEVKAGMVAWRRSFHNQLFSGNMG